MLIKFEVKNFKNFKEKLTLDLSKTNNYEFSEKAVKNGIVKTALVYGENGSGKSNLGYAIFDITLHLVDKQKSLSNYNLYENLDNGGNVWFHYQFKFENNIVDYEYEKDSPQSLIIETLTINDEKVIHYDYLKHKAIIKLKGAETLNTDLSEKNISFVKYVHSNTILLNDYNNKAFNDFISFVDNMLMFSSLEKNFYQGFTNGSDNIGSGIISRNKVKDFQEFLESVGLKYNLFTKDEDGTQVLYCKFGEKEVGFFSIASRGTCSLSLFYYWLIQLEKVSFVFLDEFDAFYHSNLAEKVVKEVLNFNNTQAVFTTHNTEIMTNDLLRPDCYMRIINGNIKSFADSTDKELRKAHNLRKMYEAGAFNEQ
jgi:AAA15 family ATPase/GTPase